MVRVPGPQPTASENAALESMPVVFLRIHFSMFCVNIPIMRNYLYQYYDYKSRGIKDASP